MAAPRIVVLGLGNFKYCRECWSTIAQRQILPTGHGFFETPKVAGFPVGLPTDIPKAWFVALSTLSKSATPPRVKHNTTADRLITPPSLPQKSKT